MYSADMLLQTHAYLIIAMCGARYVCIYIYIDTHMCAYVNMYICIYVYRYTYLQLCTCGNIHMSFQHFGQGSSGIVYVLRITVLGP